jgi:hypothetical protein
MSTSLNVVNIAVSFFTATKRRATVFRNELIFSRRVRSDVTAGAATAAGAETLGCVADTASSFVILPPTPEPATEAAAIPFSSNILAAAGDG